MTRTELKLPKGLTHVDAFKKAVKRVGGDFRGFKYDPKTGKTVVV